MRFSASFSDSVRDTVAKILSGLSKLSDVQVCAVILKEAEGLEISGVSDSAAGFGKVHVDLFNSFRVQSKANNRIAAEVDIGLLLAAFQNAAAGSDEVTLKLRKDANNNIFLTLQTQTISQINLTLDVPIQKLLPVDDMARYSEPVCDSTDAALRFPDIKSARRVLDRMKQLDKILQIKADQKNGILVFRVDTEIVSTRAIFNNLALENLEVAQGDRDQGDENEFVVASLSSKEVAGVAASIGALEKRASTVMLAIVKRSLVCIHVNFDDEATLTYYLATTADDENSGPVLENTHLLRLENVKNEMEVETQS